MKLTRFRVQMYKCVLDSGWVDVVDLTVLVGKNEAGKTSLLCALHKFNPFEPEPYSISREWPRGHRGERSDSQVVCSAEFELSPEEIAELKQITTGKVDVTKLVVTRDYAGRFEVQFPKGVFPESLNDVDALKELKAPSIHQKSHDYVISALPTFVYMDEYRTFLGTANLDQVKHRKDHKKPSEDDKTLLTIMALAELDLDQEVKKADQQDREERQYDLNDAAATLNKKVENHWKQLKYEVDFRADGQQFMTFVKGMKDKTLLRLEERSKGFQWFFSFDLMLMHETKGTLKGCVILLDEPGLHLHPAAQLDLLEILSSYAEGNTVIYSTHLPFMIDLRFPERIRVISETAQGTVVKENLTETQPEAKLVLQAALGISSKPSYLVADGNLVVEDVNDYWILTALSDLFQRSGRQNLPPEVLVTAAGGAAEITYIATLMVGQELQVVALYDTDAAGNAARDKFVNNWLALYKERNAGALSLGPTVGIVGRDYSIEDMFSEDFYLSCVDEVYGKKLAGAGADLKKLPKGEQILRRIETLFESASLQFNKGSVCKVLCKRIRDMRNVSNLPPSTARAAELLFAACHKEFALTEPRA